MRWTTTANKETYIAKITRRHTSPPPTRKLSRPLSSPAADEEATIHTRAADEEAAAYARAADREVRARARVAEEEALPPVIPALAVRPPDGDAADRARAAAEEVIAARARAALVARISRRHVSCRTIEAAIVAFCDVVDTEIAHDRSVPVSAIAQRHLHQPPRPR